MMEEQEREQNKKINQHSRKISDLEQRLKTIELDVEPRGRISSSFEAIEEEWSTEMKVHTVFVCSNHL